MHIYLGKYRSNGITNNYVFAVGTMSMQNQVGTLYTSRENYRHALDII